jgi:hypothetical protein
MFRKTIFVYGLFVVLAFFSPSVHDLAVAQDSAVADDEPNSIDPNDPRLNFTFPIQPDGKPFRFKLLLDKANNVGAVSVFHEGESLPFELFRTYVNVHLEEPLSRYWDDNDRSILLTHADLNFDGFEDLELLENDIQHLDKKRYSVYLWDNKAGLYKYSKELDELPVDPTPHPENKTLTTRDSWPSGKLEMIEQNSLLGDWSKQTDMQCGFTFTCSRLVNGEMVVTLEKPVCTENEMENLPSCPAATMPPPPGPPQNKQKQ